MRGNPDLVRCEWCQEPIWYNSDATGSYCTIVGTNIGGIALHDKECRLAYMFEYHLALAPEESVMVTG